MLSALIVFITVLLGSLGLFLMMGNGGRDQDIDRIKARLFDNDVKTQEDKKNKKKEKGAGPALINTGEEHEQRLVTRILARLRLVDRLGALIEQAGMRWSVARTMHACLALFLIFFNLVWYMVPPPFNRAAFPAALLGGALPLIQLLRLKTARLRRFEEQFPESLEFVARSMRAGHAFSVSLEMLHREFQEPLSGEFRRTFEEQNLGLPLDVALEKLAQRVPLLDVQFFVSAVLLQKRTGGNLAEVLDKLAYLIRERFKLRGRIRAISAHGRMTGMALSSIPGGVAGIMFYVNPDYAMFFVNDPTGQAMAGAALALQALGYAVIQKIVRIEV
jgi:tight adherence protein B